MRILIVYSLFISLAYADQPSDPCSIPGLPEIPISGVTDIGKSCSQSEVNKRYGGDLKPYSEQESEAVCGCLKSSSEWNSKSIDPQRKEFFDRPSFIDGTFRKTLRDDFMDLVAGFTKYNSYMLTKDHLGNVINDNILEKNGGLCNFDSIISGLKELHGTVGSASCPIPKGQFEDRISEILYTNFPDDVDTLKSDISKLSGKIDSYIGENNQPRNTCLSPKSYMDLRSSPGNMDAILDIIEKNPSVVDFRSSINSASDSKLPNSTFSDKDGFKDQITLNPFLNMAFRDSGFYHKFRQQMLLNKKDGKKNKEIFSNKEIQAAAYGSLNRNCNSFYKNIKGYLCTTETPKLHPAIMSDNLENTLKSQGYTDVEKRAVKDYYTYKYSCSSTKNPGIEKSPIKRDENDFEKYVSRVVLVNENTKDMLLKSDNKDVENFSKVFCPEGTPPGTENMANGEVALRFWMFAERKKKAGIDLQSIFQDPKFKEELGLSIQTSPTIDIELSNADKLKNGDLPNIDHERWNKVSSQLAKAGLTPVEIEQLYVIIEMQTNKISADYEDVRQKLLSDPNAPKVTARDIKNIAEGKPLPEGTTLTKDQIGAVYTRNFAQNEEKAIQVNYAQNILMNNTKIEDMDCGRFTGVDVAKA